MIWCSFAGSSWGKRESFVEVKVDDHDIDGLVPGREFLCLHAGGRILDCSPPLLEVQLTELCCPVAGVDLFTVIVPADVGRWLLSL
jgi:hypothetical protein